MSLSDRRDELRTKDENHQIVPYSKEFFELRALSNLGLPASVETLHNFKIALESLIPKIEYEIRTRI